jgi:GDPmannose 4,6-dehydratase
VDHLKADPAKARRELGWKPKVAFAELVEMMVDHDVYRLKNGISTYAAVAAHD